MWWSFNRLRTDFFKCILCSWDVDFIHRMQVFRRQLMMWRISRPSPRIQKCWRSMASSNRQLLAIRISVRFPTLSYTIPLASGLCYLKFVRVLCDRPPVHAGPKRPSQVGCMELEERPDHRWGKGSLCWESRRADRKIWQIIWHFMKIYNM